MNEIQKTYLSSTDSQIRHAALKRAVYEVLTGQESDDFWELLKKQHSYLFNLVKEVLKEYSRDVQMFEKAVGLFDIEDIGQESWLRYLLSLYVTARSKKIKNKLQKEIDVVPASNRQRIYSLLEINSLTPDFNEDLKLLLVEEGENVNDYIRAISHFPLWIWQSIVENVSPRNVSYVLQEVVRLAGRQKEEVQDFISGLVMKHTAYVGLFYYELTGVLFDSKTFDVNWQYSLLLRLIEKAQLSKDAWNEWTSKIAEAVFRCTREGTPIEDAWDKLEHALILRWKHNKKQGYLLLNLVDQIARVLAFCGNQGSFVWLRQPFNEYTSDIREVLKYELTLIKQVLAFPENEMSFYLARIYLWLISFQAGKVLDKKRQDALGKLKDIPLRFVVNSLEDLMCICPAVSDDNRQEIEALFDRVIRDNKDLFEDKGYLGIDLVIVFADYCREKKLNVSEFKKRYGAEVNSYYNELRNKSAILESLKLPK